MVVRTTAVSSRVLIGWAIFQVMCIGGIIYRVIVGQYEFFALIFVMVIATMVAGLMLLDWGGDGRDH